MQPKVARYLAYAEDRAWAGRHPHCPPLPLLTTTASRAATFVRAAGRLLAGQDRPRYGRRGRPEIARAEALVVAACGLLRDPARAVGGLCWMLPDPAAAELSLAELLAERVEAQARAAAVHARLDAQARRADHIQTLRQLVGRNDLDEQLGDPHAAEALRHLVGLDAGAWMDTEPELAAAVLAWWNDHNADPGPVRGGLRRRHRQLWTAHARALLGAAAHIAADDPPLAVYARTLRQGRLLADWQLHALRASPTSTRRQIQAAALGDYPRPPRAGRTRPLADAAVVDPPSHRPSRARRRLRRRTPAGLRTCGILTPTTEWEQPFDEECRRCGGGRRVGYAHRGQIPTLAERLDQIRAQLRRGPRRTTNG
jgi:hypothetical protein